VAGEKFDAEAFGRTLARMAQEQDHGSTNPRPLFDGQLHKDVVDDAIHGRKIADYRTALEAGGFAWYPPASLPAWNTGQPRTEGEWRNPKLRLAFTASEITARFETPEVFFQWLEHHRLKLRAARLGLALPRVR
jgi:hypothetical protein